MLRGVIRFLLLIAAFGSLAFDDLDAQPGTWAVSAGSKVQDYPENILVDDQGNTYLTGFFRDTLNFGTSEVYSAGQTDVFIAKYAVDGTVSWVRRYGWFENEFAHAMAFDTAGNVVLVGEYQDSTILVNDTLHSLDTLWYGPYAGTYDVLVLTIDPAGNLLNYKADGWFGSEHFYDVEVNSRNWKFFGGMFRTFNFFGGGLWGRGYDDAFLVAMDPANNFNWKAVASGRYIDKANAVEIIGDSLWVMAGDFQDTCWFKDTTIFSIADFEDNVFVSCWDSNKTFRWHLAGGGPGKDHLEAMVANSAGDLFICGRFDSTFSLGGLSINSAGSLDGFLAKISSTGSVLWLKAVGGELFDGITALEIGDDDRLLITGYFQGESDFDGTLLTASDSLDQDAFVAAYDAAGTLIWVRRFGGESIDKGTSVDIDASGHVYVAGVFSGSAWFGSKRLNSLGSEDIFLIRLLPDGSVAADELTLASSPQVLVWPNPADKVLNFNLEMEKPGTAVLHVMDLNGRTIQGATSTFNLRPGANQFSISTQDMKPGMYLYDIQLAGMRQGGKFVVLR